MTVSEAISTKNEKKEELRMEIEIQKPKKYDRIKWIT